MGDTVSKENCSSKGQRAQGELDDWELGNVPLVGNIDTKKEPLSVQTGSSNMKSEIDALKDQLSNVDFNKSLSESVPYALNYASKASELSLTSSISSVSVPPIYQRSEQPKGSDNGNDGHRKKRQHRNKKKEKTSGILRKKLGQQSESVLSDRPWNEADQTSNHCLDVECGSNCSKKENDDCSASFTPTEYFDPQDSVISDITISSPGKNETYPRVFFVEDDDEGRREKEDHDSLIFLGEMMIAPSY